MALSERLSNRFTKILNQLWAKEFASPFHPSLQIIRNKLAGNEYSTSDSFAFDLRSICNDAASTYASTHETAIAGGKLLSLFDKWFAKATEATVPPSAAAAASSSEVTNTMDVDLTATSSPTQTSQTAIPPPQATPTPTSARNPRKAHSTSPNPNPNPTSTSTSTSTTKKRPRSDSATRSDLTPSEQEKLNSLGDFLESCGGQASLVASWDCSEKFRGAGGYSADGKSSKNSDTYFYDEGGAQFRSKTEVARHFKLEVTRKKDSQPKAAKKVNHTDEEKLKREILKQSAKRDKQLAKVEQLEKELHTSQYPILDELLDQELNPTSKLRPAPEAIGFPGIPTPSTTDLVVVWDFLSMFDKTLNLTPTNLDDFATAIFQGRVPTTTTTSTDYDVTPVFLTEAHCALLKLIITDNKEKRGLQDNNNILWEAQGRKLQVSEDPLATFSSQGKVVSAGLDVESALKESEELSVTKKWCRALESIRHAKTNGGSQIKVAVQQAVEITDNALVKAYLTRALRKWKSGAGGNTKRPAVFLLDQFVTGRPGLENLSQVSSDEYGESDSNDNDNNVDVMDDEEEEDDDDEEEIVDEEIIEEEYWKPPSLADRLIGEKLPNEEDVTAVNWPLYASITLQKILDLYEKKANQADYDMRELRDAPPLTKEERDDRRSKAAIRLFPPNSWEGESNKPQNSALSPLETAIHSLGKGNPYHTLSVTERIVVLKVLTEAAYDSYQIQRVIKDNNDLKVRAEKDLEAHNKQLARETREQWGETQKLAKESIISGRQQKFLEDWRSKKIKTKSGPRGINLRVLDTEELHSHLNTQEEDLYDKIDEQTVAKTEIIARAKLLKSVTYIFGEGAFFDHCRFFTTRELNSHDTSLLKRLNKECQDGGLNGDIDADLSALGYSRERVAQEKRTRRQRDKMRDEAANIKEYREEVLLEIAEAIDSGDVRQMSKAIKAADRADLTNLQDEQGEYMHQSVFDLHMAKNAAEEKRDSFRKQQKLAHTKELCFTRTTPLGVDRAKSTFWKFPYDENRFWLQTQQNFATDQAKMVEALEFVVGEKTIDADSFAEFCKKEHCGLGGAPASTWISYQSETACQNLLKSLDDRGFNERALKEKLDEQINLRLRSDKDEDDDTVWKMTGDEVFLKKNLADVNLKKAKVNQIIVGAENAKMEDGENENEHDQLAHIKLDTIQNFQAFEAASKITAVNCRIRDHGRNGTITGWVDDGEIGERTNVGLWHVEYDVGSEEDLEATEVVNGVCCFNQSKLAIEGFVEEGAGFLEYRNKLGKFCGNFRDAEHCTTPWTVAKTLLDGEQRMYGFMKKKTKEQGNQWGGADSLRNGWMDSARGVDSLADLKVCLRALEDSWNTWSLTTIKGSGYTGEGGGGEVGAMTAKEFNDGLRMQSEMGEEETSWLDHENLDILGWSDVIKSKSIEMECLWSNLETRRCWRGIVEHSKSVGLLEVCMERLWDRVKGFCGEENMAPPPVAVYAFNPGDYQDYGGRTTTSRGTKKINYAESSGEYNNFF